MPPVPPSPRLLEWVEGMRAFALLEGAEELGLLAALTRPRTPAQLARATRAPASLVRPYCDALVAQGVLQHRAGKYAWSPSWAALTSPTAPLRLDDLLAGVSAIGARMRHPRARLGPTYGLAVARGVWGSPRSDEALALYHQADAQMPEVRSLWARATGSRHLELGCGMGRDLLRLPRMYPHLRVVGVERDRAVAAAVRAEARSLRLAGKASVRCGDARHFTDARGFDSVLWSQLFFPASTHDAVLHRVRALTQRGAFLLLPVAPLGGEPAARATGQLVAALRGVPIPPREELTRRVQRHGFELLRTVQHPRTDYLLFQRR